MVDGPGGFLPKTPRELRLEGAFKKVPVMIGANKEECSILVFGIFLIGRIITNSSLKTSDVNIRQYRSLRCELMSFLLFS